MAIMTKRGNLDNIVTYEHICDTYEDLQNIDPKYATLGSTAIVINQEEGLNAYMATSAGEWVSISIATPIPSNYVQKTNFTIYSTNIINQSFYATASSESNMNYHFITTTPTSYWITGNELIMLNMAYSFELISDSIGVTIKSQDVQTGITVFTITDGAIIGLQMLPK